MFSLVTSFNTPSGRRVVSFEHGSRHHGRNGYLITSDKELQEAIEKSGYFGTDIILAEEIIKEEAPKEEAKEVLPADYKAMLTDAESSIEAPEVTSIQKAKMWLQANYGKSFVGTTKDEIQKEAATIYNTLFPNW
jgi:hypothetical protein